MRTKYTCQINFAGSCVMPLGVLTIDNGLLRLCTVSGLAVGVIGPMNVVMVVLRLKADLSSRTTQRKARMANEYHFQQPGLSNNSFPVTFAISFPVTKVVSFLSVAGLWRQL